MNKLADFIFKRNVFKPILYTSSLALLISIIALANGVDAAKYVGVGVLVLMFAVITFGVIVGRYESDH